MSNGWYPTCGNTTWPDACAISDITINGPPNSTVTSALNTCCNGQVHTSDCWSYCNTTSAIDQSDWWNCVGDTLNVNLTAWTDLYAQCNVGPIENGTSTVPLLIATSWSGMSQDSTTSALTTTTTTSSSNTATTTGNSKTSTTTSASGKTTSSSSSSSSASKTTGASTTTSAPPASTTSAKPSSGAVAGGSISKFGTVGIVGLVVAGLFI